MGRLDSMAKVCRLEADGQVWDFPLNELPKLYHHHTPQTAYVAIDFEARYVSRKQYIFEMGVAVLPPMALVSQQQQQQQQHPPCPVSRDSDNGSDGSDAHPWDNLPLQSQAPQCIIEQYAIEVHNLHVTSERYARTRGWRRSREALRLFGPETEVEEEAMEAHLVTLFASVQDRFRAQLGADAPRLDMVLVVYGVAMEYQILERTYPKVLSGGFFHSWCDLQTVVRRMTGSSTDVSLIDALLRLGFPDSDFAPVRRNKAHHAGNDVLRELVLLLSLLRHAHTEEWYAYRSGYAAALAHPFQHPGRPPRPVRTGPCRPAAKPAARPFHFNRPQPYKDYPFTVGLRFESRDYLGAVAHTARALKRYFAAYRPVVVTMKKDLTNAWISLATEEDRVRFVQDINGKAFRQQVWHARALSAEGPVPPVHKQPTRRQRRVLTDKRKPGNEDVQDRVRSQRAQLRAKLAEVEDQLVLLDLGWTDAEDSEDTM